MPHWLRLRTMTFIKGMPWINWMQTPYILWNLMMMMNKYCLNAKIRRKLDNVEIFPKRNQRINYPRFPLIMENDSSTRMHLKWQYVVYRHYILIIIDITAPRWRKDANINQLKKGDEDLPELRKKWVEAAADILTGAPAHLPPLREVNHKIPIIDENKWYNYHLPWCPESLKTQLIDKIQTYKNAGWWEETNVSQAAPILCIFKRDGVKLCTIIDGRKHNDNTEKDVTPFPDQEQICHDVAWAKYRYVECVWTNTRGTQRCVENSVCHHLWHIREPCYAARRL